jgi:threonine dehydratase
MDSDGERMDRGDELTLEGLRAAHAASAEVVRQTPVLSARSVSEQCGGRVIMKAENLQRTGSFKVRGALSKLRAVGEVPGVVAASAGNHAQSLAYAARSRGVRCEVFMPAGASVNKAAAVEDFGGTVHLGGEIVDECLEDARRCAEQMGYAFVHPFDDLDVIAGQAGVGIELTEQVSELAAVVVPIGGGGLASGVAMAVKLAHPEVRVVGVQAEACAPVAASLRGGRLEEVTPGVTIADGIAVKRPGELTLPLIEQWVDKVVTVSEDEIAAAMVTLINRSKLVVEGAGAAGLGAVLAGKAKPAEDGATAVVLSGGNVDAGVLAAVAAREETREGRRIRFLTYVSDRPGGLAGLLELVAGADANVIEVSHVRDGIDLAVGQTGIELTVSVRGREHGDRVIGTLERAGYRVVRE